MPRKYFHALSTLAALVLGALLFVVLFEPSLSYKINTQSPAANSSEFKYLLTDVMGESVLEVTKIDKLTDGKNFYPVELNAISKANNSINLEVFIFHVTPIGQKFLEALTERAKAGVKVRIIIDAVGSFFTPDSFFDPLRKAGGIVTWYQPFRWYTLKRLNNRTHRNLLIIDGRVGFIGGAGIGSAWDTGEKKEKPWRDTVLQVTGPIVNSLQTAFIENWLESSGEILTDRDLFPLTKLTSRQLSNDSHTSFGSVVTSVPSPGRASRARTLFQLLIASSHSSIYINSPYFLPDKAMRQELIRAVKRGVKVTIIVPGKYNNHPITRVTSRRHYGELISTGISIYEYTPGMIHTKMMIVDDSWSVSGSTNFDSRSFALNDEINLIVFDKHLANDLQTDFNQDQLLSEHITMEEWNRRSLTERFFSIGGQILERQE